MAVDEKLGRDHRRRLESGGEDVSHAPHGGVALHRRAIPGRAERDIGGLGFLPVEEEDVAGNELVEVAPQGAGAAWLNVTDLDHFDLPVIERMRAEIAAV